VLVLAKTRFQYPLSYVHVLHALQQAHRLQGAASIRAADKTVTEDSVIIGTVQCKNSRHMKARVYATITTMI
jgi:hypothetical protein